MTEISQASGECAARACEPANAVLTAHEPHGSDRNSRQLACAVVTQPIEVNSLKRLSFGLV